MENLPRGVGQYLVDPGVQLLAGHRLSEVGVPGQGGVSGRRSGSGSRFIVPVVGAVFILAAGQNRSEKYRN
jgi:hypothetical protein